jgi:alpha-L-fucosidase
MEKVDRASAQLPFHADWKSLAGFEIPQWCLDAEFGIFIHWGVYSVPAFGNEWYPRNMNIKGDTGSKKPINFRHGKLRLPGVVPCPNRKKQVLHPMCKG